MKKVTKLQSRPNTRRNIFWDKSNLDDLLENGLVLDSNNPKDNLILELDRRFVQLWDKTQHEQKFLGDIVKSTEDMLAVKQLVEFLSIAKPNKSLAEAINDLVDDHLEFEMEYYDDYMDGLETAGLDVSLARASDETLLTAVLKQLK